MSHRGALRIAETLGGEAILGEDDRWIVRIIRGDGRVVVISESAVDEFYDDEARAQGQCFASIRLA